jgi:pimeloyl-ACP methyl ester carboxylesterase
MFNYHIYLKYHNKYLLKKVNLFKMAYRNNLKHVRNGIYQLNNSSTTKHLILIHGLVGDYSFGKDEDHMEAFYDKLDAAGVLEGYSVWSLTYNTVFMPFDVSGKWLAEDMLRLNEYDFTQAIVVGFSMGGLIARTMLCNNFDFKYLVTIDTPHHGPVPGLSFAAIPTLHGIITSLQPFLGLALQGIPSMVFSSKSQLDIFNHPKDIAKRKGNYAFYAIDYRDNDIDPYHGSDYVVSNHSQLGIDLGDVRWRYIWKKNYTANDPEKGIGKPHAVASKPEYCEKVIELLHSLLNGEDMPALALAEPTPTPNGETNTGKQTPPAFEITNVNVWYYMDSEEGTYVYANVEIENRTAKPIELLTNKILLSRIGFFEPKDDAITKIMLPPKQKKTVLLMRYLEYTELLPETIDLFLQGSMVSHPVWFIPMPVNEGVALPTESIWSIESDGLQATKYYNPEEDKTFYKITGTFINNSPLMFFLKEYVLSITPDGASSPVSFDTDSDVYSGIVEGKYLTIAPNTKTAFTLSFYEYYNSNAQTVNMRIGSKALSVFDKTLTLVAASV